MELIAAQRKKFFAEFTRRIAESNDDYLTVRCWSGKGLRKLLTGIRGELIERRVLSHSFPRSLELIAWLQELGLAHKLKATAGPAVQRESDFYVVSLGANANTAASPYELLQAYEPKGTLCFLGALAFHELTTQVPPFYHVATLLPKPRQVRLALFENHLEEAKVQPDRTSRNRLGSLVFTFGGYEFFATRRYEHLVPGAQIHVINARTRLRFTDVEQSLLDTLTHPEACGGEAVVFEAWQRGWERARQEVLASYVKLAGPNLVRRFGALATVLELDLAAPLKAVLEETEPVDRGVPPLHLLRGIPGQVLDERWHVLRPF